MCSDTTPRACQAALKGVVLKEVAGVEVALVEAALKEVLLAPTTKYTIWCNIMADFYESTKSNFHNRMV